MGGHGRVIARPLDRGDLPVQCTKPVDPIKRLPRRPFGAPRNDIHDGDKIIEKFLDCGGKIFYNVRTYGNLLLERIFTMAKEYKITSLRLQDLEKELNYLKTTREREIAAMIAEARSYGDLSENSEYDAAKNEQAKLYGRIAEIEDVLSHAVIIEDENEATGRVGLGCTIVVEDANGKQTTYVITGSQEANPMLGKLSDDSPFGRAVVGKAAGESFTVNAPAGSFTMKVISVSREG